MAGRAEDYKRKAEECMDAGKSAAHLDVKNQYLELARQSQELATHVERVGRLKGK